MSDLAQLMLEHTPDMLMLVVPQTLAIVEASAEVGRTLGYSVERIQGMAITDIENALQDVFYWDDVRNGHLIEIQQQEGLYRRADGELLTVNKSIRRVQAADGSTLLLVHAAQTQSVREVQDALAQTLSKLRATLESTGNGILVLDWHGRVDSMNQLFSRMWDIPPSLLADRDDTGILTFLSEQVVESALFHARLHAIVDKGETQDLLHLHNGRVFEVSSRPQYLEEHIVGRVFGFQDITERTLAEQALRESRSRLEDRVSERTADLNAANATLWQEKERQVILIHKLEETQNHLLQAERMASIGQLAAGVAHEINNPVGFVNSNLGSLQRYVKDVLQLLAVYEEWEPHLPDESRHLISKIKQEIDVDFVREDLPALLAESLDGLKRVTRIVQDLKDFSHVDEAERQWADLEAGIDSTLRVVWNEIKYKAQVVKEYAGLDRVQCFPFQLNQVFMNLLVNAAHAIDERGTITVRTGQDDKLVWVEIEDTGRGIAPEHMARIFDPFFTTKPVGQGTGLGLSVAYGIVQKHGGIIEVRSELGKGACFTVKLPKIPDQAIASLK